jgi:hypothetical protein
MALSLRQRLIRLEAVPVCSYAVNEALAECERTGRLPNSGRIREIVTDLVEFQAAANDMMQPA